MKYGDEKQELERILAACSELRERLFFSMGCTFAVFLLSVLSQRMGYQWLMIGLFVGTIIGAVYGLSIAAREKRLRWRYYNLSYRVQIEHEAAERGGVLGRDRK